MIEARDAQVWCDDGKAYTDWIAGLGSISLGYQYPEVDDAVMAQMNRVVTGPLPNTLEEPAAELLCEMLGWPEQVRWTNSGSESTAGAMMIARRATGRRLVYSAGYHGWHETHQPGPDLLTIPEGVIADVPHDYRVAAVIVEVGRERVPLGYLGAWREWCDRTGALLIIDEVWSGFRIAVGGATEKYGGRPDLATFSKALGNGYAVGAIVGPSKLMTYAHDVSSTFGGNGVSLAAAMAVMRVYQDRPVIKRLDEIGERLLIECPQFLTGVAARPHFKRPDRAVSYVQQLAKAGHLAHPAGVTPTYSHDDDDVASLIEAIKELDP